MLAEQLLFLVSDFYEYFVIFGLMEETLDEVVMLIELMLRYIIRDIVESEYLLRFLSLLINEEFYYKPHNEDEMQLWLFFDFILYKFVNEKNPKKLTNYRV